MRSLVVAGVLLLSALPLEAALSKAAQEWRRGPEQWLMTAEEQRAWKQLQSDEEAIAFIDLFWARRDPTPDTPLNEAREEFLKRVRYADANFNEKRRRGALTERGQVYILLGPPASGTHAGAFNTQDSGMGAKEMSSAAGARGQAIHWTWPREMAKALGVPKLEVAFGQLVGSDTFVRDVRLGNFANVVPKAQAQMIYNRELTTVPDWAERVGAAALQSAGTAAQVRSGDVKAAGRIGRIVLFGDIGTFQSDAATDPIASLQSLTTFPEDGEMAWVVEYCAPESFSALQLEARVRTSRGASDFNSVYEAAPIPLKSVAGCSAIPGVMSLTGLKRDAYTLEVTLVERSGAKLETKAKFTIR